MSLLLSAAGREEEEGGWHNPAACALRKVVEISNLKTVRPFQLLPFTVIMAKNVDGAILDMCGLCGVRPGGKVALKKCSGCKSVAYCSQSHQKADWAAHKNMCKLLRKKVLLYIRY